MDIEKTYFLPFSRERVYAAWTSSETVIAPATRMDISPVLGGHYRLFIETPEMSSSNQGTFLEVISNEFLRYSWEWDHNGEVTEIAVIFKHHTGGTEINLSHKGFTNLESRSMHDSGWDSYVDALTTLVAKSTI